MEEKNGIATLVKIHFFKSKLDLKINTTEDYLEEVEPGKFRIKNFGNKAPLVYALEA